LVLENLGYLSALARILQNDPAPMLIDNAPFLDLLQGSKTAKAGEIVVQAAIAYARGLSRLVAITHMTYTALRGRRI
jgi:hypothetical protein